MYANPHTGKFIVFEGPDGSGQSTQVALLTAYLARCGFEVVATKEPTEEIIGKKIRKILQKQEAIDPFKLQVLFAEDRAMHLEKLILPALSAGKIVISDRYYLSSIAFGSLNSRFDNLFEINNDFILPDATFCMDVLPSVCMERISKRGGKTELFEHIEKLQRVYNAFKFLSRSKSGVYTVDGEKPKLDVHQAIVTILQSLNWWPNRLLKVSAEKCPA